MPVQTTIIGMGQIGTSIGLALAEHKENIYRVGHDKEIGIARKAEKMGALDRVEINIPNAVREAGVVVLALPLDQIREMLEIIAPDLKENAVVLDTAPVKQVVAGWAKELLPESTHYVGLVPVLNPIYLHEQVSGVDTAHADLFQRGMMAVVPPAGASGDAVKLATDFISLIGSEHLFFDPVEIDSLMAAVHLLPALMAAGLLNMTIDQPGWLEGRKLAGKAYAGTTMQFDVPAALSSAALHNQEPVLRVLDGLIANLAFIREEVNKQNEEALLEYLASAQKGRARWSQERLRGNWVVEQTAPNVEMPTSKDFVNRLFGFRKPKEKK